MGESSRLVVTGISNSNQEGFIAASLRRIGWEVVFRATSSQALTSFLKSNPEVHILLSDDFKGVDSLLDLHPILLGGYSHPIVNGGIESPTTDQELSRIMENSIHHQDDSPLNFQPHTGNLIALASLGRAVGTTTLALNMAQEFALSGNSILLIDANLQHPQVATLCDLNGLTKAVKVTRFGFSATEINSVESLALLITDLARFDYVIVDLGQLIITERTQTGRRISDILLSWSLRSTKRLHLISSSQDLALEELKATLRIITPIAAIPNIDHIITLSSALGRRDREKILADSREMTGLTPHIYPWDKRSFDLARSERSTLAVSAPKSLLRVEISRHIAQY